MLSCVPTMPTFWRVLIINGCSFFKSFFCICWNGMVFILQFIDMVYNIDWFADVEKSLHPWDESHLIMVYDLFIVGYRLLVFCWGFFIYVHQWYWPVLFFFCVISLSGFGVRVMMTSQDEFGSFPSSAVCWNYFRRIGVNSSLNVW